MTSQNQDLPSSGGMLSHCGTLERALRQVAKGPEPSRRVDRRAPVRQARSPRHHAVAADRDSDRWRRSVARVPDGAQATEVDCVGVHAVAAENVWTRDLNVDPTMRFLNGARKGCCAGTVTC
jgi:hypothetical protein